MRWIDIAAVVLVLVGISLAFCLVGFWGVYDLAAFLSHRWANPAERWLIAVIGLASVWLLARWKKV